MIEGVRKSGIEFLGDIPWGSHFCHFYETKEDLLDILVPYFVAGLKNHEFCVWVVCDPLSVDDARAALMRELTRADRQPTDQPNESSQASLPSSPDQRWLKSIEILPHTNQYLKDCSDDFKAVIDGWRGKLEGVLAEGYAGLRVNGNVGWLTTETGAAFAEYENALDEKLAGEPILVLCSYPIDGTRAANVLEVVRTHRMAAVRRKGRWEAIEAPEFKQAKAEINRLKEQLEKRVSERTRQLAAANEELAKEITERKRAENALRRSEDSIRLIIDTIPVMAWTIQPDGRIDFVNQRWREYMGSSLQQLAVDPLAPIHPEDRPRVLEKWLTCMTRGEPYDDEQRLRGADGEYRWFLVRTAPLRDDGRITKWFGISIDIEDRKRAEETLKEAQRKLEEAQRVAHVGYYEHDLDTDIVTMSDENYRILGLPPQDSITLARGFEFIHPDDRARLHQMRIEASRTGEPFDAEYRLIRPDGELRFIHSHSYVVRDDRGRAHKTFGVSQDITDRKRAEEQLKSSNAALRALSARVQAAREEESARIAREIHDELGAVLSGLKWDLEEIDEEISKSANAPHVSTLKAKLKSTLMAARNAVDTVRRISSELRPTALEELGLVEALRWHVEEFETRTGITVTCECPADGIDLNKEQSTAVFRVVQEALTNVLRHAQATKIDVTIVQEQDHCLLTIADNGIGITEEQKADAQAIGLLGMQERMNLIGGSISIKAGELGGTIIRARVPTQRDPSQS